MPGPIERRRRSNRESECPRTLELARAIDVYLGPHRRLQLIGPPSGLLAVLGLDDSPRSRALANKAMWDQVVQMIGRDGEGYKTVLALYKRLDSEVRETERQREKALVEKKLYSRVEDVITFEVERYGRNATLASSLGSDPEPRRDGYLEWSWSPEQDSVGKSVYILTVSYDDEPLELDDYDKTFSSDSTWMSAMMWRLPFASLKMHSRRQELIEWRRDVIEEVLDDFETQGHVSLYRHGYSPVDRDLTENETRFVQDVVRLRLRAEDDDAAPKLTTRTRVLDAVAKLWGDRAGDVLDTAVSLGAYRQKRGRGRPKKELEQREWKHFCEVIDALDAQLS